ncbi:RNA-directed DNA polymerase from mobile element jockey [Plakobranchus ocellatus]|uniref:RNA-directed DNA polymerase from mobile element jockey n=1 Tax=Plakobranchus ocellatus TaxID=259542 RepID=A0AAV4DAT3_9GAST|nr:RNA-directed DNA polymerase from mobile element jockey [Plakobranchus ocellatus]
MSLKIKNSGATERPLLRPVVGPGSNACIFSLNFLLTFGPPGTFPPSPPPSWREASEVSIPKPGKDPFDLSNYRPVALTSCWCKTLERMVNDRLVHVLESRNLLSKVQCGFRKDHSTLDHLVRLETFIKRAFARKKQVLAVFSILKKLTILHGGMEF